MSNSAVRKLTILTFIDSGLSEDKRNVANLRDGFNQHNMTNVIKIYNRIKAFIFHKYHFLGNMLHFWCTRCGHPTKSHVEEDYATWKCKDCDENDNICIILDE